MEDTKHPTSSQSPSPSPQQQVDQALELCLELKEDFKRRANRHKRTFLFLRYSSVFLVIAVTIVSTLTTSLHLDAWIVPLLSGLSALCTTLLSVTNAQQRWIHSRGVQQRFEAEKFLYLQRASRYAACDEHTALRLFSERLIEIWSEVQQGWAHSVSNASSEPPVHSSPLPSTLPHSAKPQR